MTGFRRRAHVFWMAGVAGVLIFGWLAVGPAKAAPAPPSAAPEEWTRAFDAAGAAFDEGRYNDAIDQYSGLLDQSAVASPLLFNLGNACFRAGRLSEAVLHYRRAWYLAPRDPDIRANLNFAMREAKAVMTPESATRRVFRTLALSEWWVLATATWWVLGLAAVAGILKKPWRAKLGRAAALFLLVLIVALFAIWDWTRLQSGREQVIMNDRVQALYAPLEDAQAHFAVPAGSIVESLETEPPWAKISVGNKAGWIRSEVAKTVATPPEF